ncbi:hypothetical protein [Amycolatopsis minnesotensis]|uniref:hypothetical protein n=1 Tax=Amycolatopsis minnesotensis TaxID=337894 RepID=UPI0031D4DF4D
MAAALAAVTAAVLGSTIGVAGTVVGAGIASVITTVGGELYLRSLHRTKEAAQRTKDLAKALAVKDARATRAMPVRQRGTARHGAPGWPTADQDEQATVHLPRPGLDGDATVQLPKPGETMPPPDEPGRLRKLRWPLIIGTSAAAFVAAIVLITGFELTTGNAISGGNGTTAGHLFGGGKQQEKTPEQPAPSRENPGEDKTGSPSTSPSSRRQAPPTSGQQRPPESSAPSTQPSTPKSSDTPTPTKSEAPPTPGSGNSGNGGNGGNTGNGTGDDNAR